MGTTGSSAQDQEEVEPPALNRVRPSLVDGAERALRSWLAPGRYRHGDRLPPEHELAAMLGISRGTLRSALRRLEDSGEIVRRQGSGTFVARIGAAQAFGDRLERLESFSSVAQRQGVTLTAIDVRIEHGPSGPEAADALGLTDRSPVTTISSTMLAAGRPVAVMHDVVHPSVPLPEDLTLRDVMERGKTVLDVLIELGVPVTFSRTAITPALLSGRERTGKQLQLRGATACLELEEVIFAGREDRVAYSRDVFVPEGIEVMVMRSVDAPRPARIAD